MSTTHTTDPNANNIFITVTPHADAVTKRQRFELIVDQPRRSCDVTMRTHVPAVLSNSPYDSHHAIADAMQAVADEKTSRETFCLDLNVSAAKRLVGGLLEATRSSTNTESKSLNVAETITAQLESALESVTSGIDQAPVIIVVRDTKLDKESAVPVCPECAEPVDADGYAIDEGHCSMSGMGWSHPDDCRTCGHIVCDLSC